jgi:hypothetical protein
VAGNAKKNGLVTRLACSWAGEGRRQNEESAAGGRAPVAVAVGVAAK